MPTGSGKSSLCRLLHKLVEDTREILGNEPSPSWLAVDQSLEIFGCTNQ